MSLRGLAGPWASRYLKPKAKKRGPCRRVHGSPMGDTTSVWALEITKTRSLIPQKKLNKQHQASALSLLAADAINS